MQWKAIVRQAGYSVLAAAAVWTLNGCNGSQPPAKPVDKPAQTVDAAHKDDHDDHDHGHHHHHHAEKGPHDGTLVALGEEAAHVEFVLDKETGKLTAYILDAEAKEAVAIKQEQIVLAFTVTEEHEGEEKDAKKGDVPELESLTLSAVSPNDGEASEFAGESEKLKGAEHFDAVIESITIKDKEFKAAEFKFPEGNEHDHHHH